MTITEALVAEHVVFHNLFDHVERVVPGLKTLAGVQTLAGALVSTLKAHSEGEDKLLIEPLEHGMDHLGQRETFHEEHEEIDEKLRAACTARTVEKAKRALQVAVLLAREHFDKEERLVFPMAEKLLSQKTLKELGRKWHEQRKVTG